MLHLVSGYYAPRIRASCFMLTGVVYKYSAIWCVFYFLHKLTWSLAQDRATR